MDIDGGCKNLLDTKISEIEKCSENIYVPTSRLVQEEFLVWNDNFLVLGTIQVLKI